MTTTALAGSDRLTIVKHLAAGKDPDFVAAATGHTRETVLQVGASHGHPDRDKLAWAADILAKKTDEIPTAEHTTAADVTRPTTPQARPTPARPRATQPPAPRPAPVTATAAPTPPVQPAAGPADAAQALIATGRKSTRAATRALADKAAKALDRLAKEVHAEEQRKKEAARRAAEEAKVRSEVALLEAELAAKKALLGHSRAAKGSAATRTGTDPKAVRAWAKTTGIECPPVGRVPNRVVDAYRAAQNGAAA